MESTTLQSQQFNTALAILEKEQQVSTLTNREQRFFWLFHIWVFLLVAVYILDGLRNLLLFDPGQHIDQVFISNILYWCYLVLAITIIPLLITNLKLAQKLWRQHRLRQTLGINAALKTAFRKERRRKRLINGLVITLIAFASVATLVSMAYVFSGFLDSLERHLNPPLFPTLKHFGYLIFGRLMLCLSLITFYFLRLGKERSDVVNRMQQTLSEHRIDFKKNPDSQLDIDINDYNRIARLERTHIIDTRNLSIEKAHHKRNDDEFMIQRSRTMRDAMNSLNPKTRLQVEDRILRLLSQPRPVEAILDSETGYLQLLISDTNLSLQYQVEDDKHLIKIYSLKNTDTKFPEPVPEA